MVVSYRDQYGNETGNIVAKFNMAERREDLHHVDVRNDGRKPSPLKEPFVGNVSKCFALPPDCSSGAKKGHLQFDACFEGGTLFINYT